MFSSYERLQKRSGKKGVDRFQYLKELVEEFTATENIDFENKSYVLQNGGVHLFSECLTSNDESTVLSAITSLMFLVTPQSKSEITNEKVVKLISDKAESDNSRISNLAKIFLSDYCSSLKVLEIRKQDIPSNTS